MEIHELRIRKDVFEELVENKRTFDIVPNDNYQVGEYLHYYLESEDQELNNKARELFFKITYITENAGLGTNYCVLQLKKVMFVEKEVK